MAAGVRAVLCVAGVLFSAGVAAFDHAHKAWDVHWFKEDFEPRDRYFARYADMLGVPRGSTPPLAFLDYDWSLNDSRSSSPR